ncbi:hypothetical protein DFI_18500 (plasmid) [Deinococcus ficus]|uniref:Uncharacterized protein n=1 Tax=Deinococcus ficus TaxID=317577 RepID=A0A221T2R9_9DEIO|nr:hypothetical protein DFI_18500 [Deinococcus ficus]
MVIYHARNVVKRQELKVVFVHGINVNEPFLTDTLIVLIMALKDELNVHRAPRDLGRDDG